MSAPSNALPRLIAFEAGPPSQQPPPRRLPVTRPPSGLCLQGRRASGAPGRRGRAPGSAGWALAGGWEAPASVP
jgi:hypothetical protein